MCQGFYPSLAFSANSSKRSKSPSLTTTSTVLYVQEVCECGCVLLCVHLRIERFHASSFFFSQYFLSKLSFLYFQHVFTLHKTCRPTHLNG